MLQSIPHYIAYARKAVIQVIGLLTALLTLGLLPDPYSVWVSTGIAVLTTIVHYMVPNALAPGSTEALDEFEVDTDSGGDIPEDWKPAPVVLTGQLQKTEDTEPEAPVE